MQRCYNATYYISTIFVKSCSSYYKKNWLAYSSATHWITSMVCVYFIANNISVIFVQSLINEFNIVLPHAVCWVRSPSPATPRPPPASPPHHNRQSYRTTVLPPSGTIVPVPLTLTITSSTPAKRVATAITIQETPTTTTWAVTAVSLEAGPTSAATASVRCLRMLAVTTARAKRHRRQPINCSIRACESWLLRSNISRAHSEGGCSTLAQAVWRGVFFMSVILTMSSVCTRTTSCTRIRTTPWALIRITSWTGIRTTWTLTRPRSAVSIPVRLVLPWRPPRVRAALRTLFTLLTTLRRPYRKFGSSQLQSSNSSVARDHCSQCHVFFYACKSLQYSNINFLNVSILQKRVYFNYTNWIENSLCR